MITSRLTSKAQTTVPQPVRKALQLREGDQIAYTIKQDGVVLTRLSTAVAGEDPFVAFHEWGEDADTRAYARL